MRECMYCLPATVRCQYAHHSGPAASNNAATHEASMHSDALKYTNADRGHVQYKHAITECFLLLREEHLSRLLAANRWRLCNHSRVLINSSVIIKDAAPLITA